MRFLFYKDFYGGVKRKDKKGKKKEGGSVFSVFDFQSLLFQALGFPA